MIVTLALALLLSQDPKPGARTVEERLKELVDKIDALDKKAAALSDENAKLQKQVDEARNRRELLARQPGPVWIKRYAPAVEFTEKQSAEIEELWYSWTKQDFEKPCDVPGWKGREEILRGKLTAEQRPRLARKVREEQSNGVTLIIKNIVQMAKLPPDTEEAIDKVVRPKVTIEEGMLLPAAHPDQNPSWIQIAGIVEDNLSDVSKGLTESQTGSLRQLLARWKPKSR